MQTTIDLPELGRSLFDESNDALIIFHPQDMTILDVNPHAQRLMGVSRRELLKTKITDLFLAGSTQLLEELFDSCHHTQLFHSRESYRMRGKANAILDVNVSVSRLHMQPDVLGVISVRDVSERKAIENELHETKERLAAALAGNADRLNAAKMDLRTGEQRYRSLVDILPSGIQGIDLDGKLTFANAMLGAMHGCKPDDLIGRHVWDFEITEERRQRVKACFDEFSGKQSPLLSYESSFRTVHGRSTNVETTWAHDRNADGELLGILSVVSDVTQRKQTEELIRKENEILEAISNGESLSHTLERITSLIESQSPDVLASVLLLNHDGIHLNHGAGSSLPAEYRSAIDGVAIGEAVGSCGTAAIRGEPVFVKDIATDPRWHDFRDLALRHNLASCWSTPIKGSDGGILGTFAIYAREASDPTANHLRLIEMATHLAAVAVGRNRSIEALAKSEQYFRSIFEQAAVGVARINSLTGEFMQVNQRYRELIGYELSELLGNSFHDITHPDDLQQDLENMARLRSGEVPEFSIEKRYRHKDNSLVWVNLTVSPLWQPGESPSEHIAIAEDITQRKLADEERESRHQSLVKLDECVRKLFKTVQSRQPFFESVCQAIESLFEVDLCAVPIIDPDGLSFRYEAASGPKADLLLGESMPIAGGGLCGWVVENEETLCVVDMREDDRVISELALALEVNTAIVAPLNVEGKVIGGLSVFRKKAPFTQYELRTLNLFAQSVAAAYVNKLTLGRLEQRVSERTAELAETNEELESFAQSVSHDLRAPLRAMEGFAIALQEDCGPLLNDEGREFIQHIVESAKRMDGMVHDLLTYSRIGRSELRVRSITIESIVKDSVDRLSSEVLSQNASMEVETGSLAIMGHRSTLVQIVSNLIANALKFVEPNAKPKVRIRAEQCASNRVRLSVEDNGIGIDQEYHERIFNVFERLHGIESYPGTGIGLAIVARACERLGGSYGMESTVGNGSRFWIEFPQGHLNE